MTELQIEELERNLAENDSYKEEKRSANDAVSNFGEKVRDILTALEADEEIDNFEEEEVAIIEEIAEVLEKRQKDKLAGRDETAKVDKVLYNFNTHSNTKTNESIYAGGVVVTNTLGVKINMAAETGVSVEEKVSKS